MKAITNWDTIQAPTESRRLPAGAYVCVIDHIIDHTMEPKPYLEVFFNPYDEDEKKYLATDELRDPERAWRWAFRLYIGNQFGMARFKELVEAVEASNDGYRFPYAQDGAEQTLCKHFVGLVIRYRVYCNRDNKTRRALDVTKSISVADVQAHNYPAWMLEERDTRTDEQRAAALEQLKAEEGTPTPLAESDIPF